MRSRGNGGEQVEVIGEGRCNTRWRWINTVLPSGSVYRTCSVFKITEPYRTNTAPSVCTTDGSVYTEPLQNYWMDLNSWLL